MFPPYILLLFIAFVPFKDVKHLYESFCASLVSNLSLELTYLFILYPSCFPNLLAMSKYILKYQILDTNSNSIRGRGWSIRPQDFKKSIYFRAYLLEN